MVNLHQAHIGLTTRCNLKCPHCYSIKERQKKGEFDISLSNLDNILKRLKSFGVFKIIYAYSESLLYDDFWKAIELTNSYDFDIELTTNALKLNKNIITKLSDSGVNKIQISLDFPNKNHDVFRNSSGLFEKVKHSLQLLKENGKFRTRVLCTQWSDDISFYKEFQNLADIYDIDVVAFLSAQCFDERQKCNIKKIISTMAEDKRFVFHSPYFTPKDCFVGEIIHINPWGFFTFCPLSSEILGNVLMMSDEEIDNCYKQAKKLSCISKSGDKA